eukprot:353202-Chlamydomonas_euryale.AAC.2
MLPCLQALLMFAGIRGAPVIADPDTRAEGSAVAARAGYVVHWAGHGCIDRDDPRYVHTRAQVWGLE